MRLSRFALAGLAVIFGLAAWILFRGEAAGDGAAGTETGAGATAAGAPLPGTPGAAGGDGAAPARAEAAISASGDAAASLITGPRLIVKVLDLVQRRPVPGATVWVFDPDHYDAEAFAAALALEPDMEVLAPRFAQQLTADAQGQVVVSQPRRWIRLLGRHEQRYGEHYQETGPDGQVAKLLLETDSLLRVRVTDAAGQGQAGVPVGLRTRRDQQAEWLAERTTGADGRTLFAHAQRIVIPRAGSVPIELAPALPLAEPPVIPLRIAALPAEEQVLILPATGSVLVRLLDPDRRPLLSPAQVLLQKEWKPRPDWLDEGDFQSWPLGGSHSAAAEGGTARFARVGLGLELEVGVDFDGTSNYEITLARGPERAGEETVIEAVQKVLRPSLVLRVMRPDGSPLANADLELLMRTTNAEWSYAQSKHERSDAEGWLRSTLDGDWVQERTDSQRSLEIRYRAPDTDLRLAGRLPGRAAWRAGPNDLGTLRLDALAVLAAGHVVDEAGQPVIGASVMLSRRLMRRGRESWRDDNSMMDRSAVDGSFALTGFLPEGVYRLAIRHADYKPEVQPWREQAADHRIVLKRGRFLQGRLLLEPELATGNLELRVVPAGTAPGQGGVEATARADRYGQFRCGPGVSERVDLWIWDRQTEQMLYRVEALAAQDPGAEPDPRLDPLDLRGKLYEVEVAVRSLANEPLKDGVNFGLTRDAVPPENWSGTDKQDFKILVADEGWKLWVQAEGHRREMVDLTGRKVEVSLRSGPRVNIRLADAGVRALAEEMYVNLRKEGPNGDEIEQKWHDLRTEGVPVSLDEAGFYRLTLYFRPPSSEEDWNWILYPPEGFPVEIRDLSGVQEILLPWTVAAVQAVIPGAEQN